MDEFTVYDKVDWHLDGEDCPDLETAKAHFQVIMDWLKAKECLNEEGEEAYQLAIDRDFSLHSDMVTEQGNAILQECYKKWVNSIEYGSQLSTEFFDKCFEKIR